MWFTKVVKTLIICTYVFKNYIGLYIKNIYNIFVIHIYRLYWIIAFTYIALLCQWNLFYQWLYIHTKFVPFQTKRIYGAAERATGEGFYYCRQQVVGSVIIYIYICIWKCLCLSMLFLMKWKFRRRFSDNRDHTLPMPNISLILYSCNKSFYNIDKHFTFPIWWHMTHTHTPTHPHSFTATIHFLTPFDSCGRSATNRWCFPLAAQSQKQWATHDNYTTTMTV